MQIKEVCELCGLTKKAVEYYERQGLITPRAMENGYRDYGDVEIHALKEISVLRRCGMGVEEIRTVRSAGDRSAALARYLHKSGLNVRRMQAAQACIRGLMNGYDIDGAFEDIRQSDAQMITVRERLLFAFPGHYGIWLSLHFGRFLEIAIETDAQRAAYERILQYLDEVPATLSDELSAYLEQFMSGRSYDAIIEMESTVDSGIKSFLADPQTLYDQFDVEAYLQYRLSDEFKKSPAGKLGTMMLAFQKSSGYAEVFIESMKALSPAYRAYCAELETANDALLRKYPQARLVYGDEEREGS